MVSFVSKKKSIIDMFSYSSKLIPLKCDLGLNKTNQREYTVSKKDPRSTVLSSSSKKMCKQTWGLLITNLI